MLCFKSFLKGTMQVLQVDLRFFFLFISLVLSSVATAQNFSFPVDDVSFLHLIAAHASCRFTGVSGVCITPVKMGLFTKIFPLYLVAGSF